MTVKQEYCDHPTPNGPCTLKKGHKTGYHRHRIYQQVTWTIETVGGIKIESGAARVALNYAVTSALENHERVVIHVKRWEDSREISAVNDAV